jgi:hypothetical protein
MRDFKCSFNQLSSLDISQNTLIYSLSLEENLLSNLDASYNPNLIYLRCDSNQLTSIDVSANTSLSNFYCSNNNLYGLDLSQNGVLRILNCSDNNLVCLNVKNGNNNYFQYFAANNNPYLSCIEVDNVTWSDLNWTLIDSLASFNTVCPNSCLTGIRDISTYEYSIYPNPVSQDFTMAFDEWVNNPYVEIIDNAGQIVFGTLCPSATLLNINPDIPVGFYCVRVTVNGKLFKIQKFVKY